MNTLLHYLNREPIKRALRTFIQTAVAYILTAVATIDFTDADTAKTALIGLAISAIAAGLSAVMNLQKAEADEAETDTEAEEIDTEALAEWPESGEEA